MGKNNEGYSAQKGGKKAITQDDGSDLVSVSSA
jgi:hypothetical protein